jgi:rhodanese-related sulfurtransferase
MRTLLFTAVLSLSVLACSKSDKAEHHAKLSDSVPALTVDELDAKLASGDCQAVDANGDATRKKLGVIPGAVLLTDSDTFSTSELPADKSKTLVFYCANTYCGASHEAAARALTAGYTNVKVLPDGIAGWVKAGKQTTKI